MGRQKKKCPVCKELVSPFLKHIENTHAAFYAAQEQQVIAMWEEGISSRKIAESESVIFSGGSSVRRVLSKYKTREELESGRKKMISKDIKRQYESGEREDQIKKTTALNKTDDMRQKNSEGVKKAYEEGRLKAWSEGLTKETSDKKRSASEAASRTLTSKAIRGELKTLFKSGKDSSFWKEDRTQISRPWRGVHDFKSSDKKKMLARAHNKCECCGISDELLLYESEILQEKNILELDHITPICLGGVRDWESNGQVLCTRCHKVKTIVDRWGVESSLDARKKSIIDIYRIMLELFPRFSAQGDVLVSDEFAFGILPLDKNIILGKHWGKRVAGLTKNRAIFYYDEWVNNKALILQMVKYRLGEVSQTVGARKCIIRETSALERRAFFEKNHISGDVRSKVCFGLFYKEEMVAALSLRSTFVKKYGNIIEIARFAIKAGVSVPGAFSKLLGVVTSWARKNNYQSILTYADLRVGEGLVYSKNGFRYVGSTDVSYGYTDGKERYDRFRFRAQEGLTEKEYAKKHGVHKVYGFKNNIFVLDL